MLKDKDRIIMPFVQINENNDMVRWKSAFK